MISNTGNTLIRDLTFWNGWNGILPYQRLLNCLQIVISNNELGIILTHYQLMVNYFQACEQLRHK